MTPRPVLLRGKLAPQPEPVEANVAAETEAEPAAAAVEAVEVPALPAPAPASVPLVAPRAHLIPAGRHLEITATPLTIGRDAQRVLSIADPDLSRFHLRVSLVDGRVVAEDMGSTNGTFVDGRRLVLPCALPRGSTKCSVGVGDFTLTFVEEPGRSATSVVERSLQPVRLRTTGGNGGSTGRFLYVKGVVPSSCRVSS